MHTISRRALTGSLAGALAASLVLTGCGGGQQATPAADASSASTVVIEDNHGKQTVTLPPKSVVATDNRTFETLQSWGVKLAAAPLGLVPTTNPYRTDKSIVDLGTHREPKMESVVAAEPDLVINGQRFAPKYEEFRKLAPKATILELDPREGQPLAGELKRQTTALGEVFGKQAEAQKLTTALDQATERAKAAYKPGQKVMAVNVSGGEIGYIAPKKGRTLGPVFEMLSLTPALEVAGATDDHQGDDISVEAIAKANPDWILVLDRDAATSAATESSYKPAKQVIENSAALKNVAAVKNQRVLYMPNDTYTNEGIQTYTEFLGTMADAFEKAD
ncbi:siderophore ABC transporter substrate-binding protein [Luteococcus peritonei]|uniref:Siderophore ABC transporter substrate-binding protein n=1 Tax=Luteococcus peritonei TaxID=88874 RepID=A0ABW4RVU8_9ACTN